MKDLGFEKHEDLVAALLERGADPWLLRMATKKLIGGRWAAIVEEVRPPSFANAERWRQDALRLPAEVLALPKESAPISGT